MTDISSLQIQVDARQLREASEALNRLAQTATTTEHATTRVGTAAATMNNSVRNSVDSIRQAESATNRLGSAFSTLQHIIYSFGLLRLASDILKTNMEMESLRSRLKSVTGSAEEAAKSFEYIRTMAASTPFEIKGLTEAYITLQNYGLKPTAVVMDALTNQSAKSGASAQNLQGIAIALGQAWSKGKLQGQEILQLINQSVPVYDLLSKVTGKNAAELSEMAEKGEITRATMEKLIVTMGEMAKGANADAMETLRGKISNLSDAWHTFEDTLLQDKSEGFLKTIVEDWTLVLESFTKKLTDDPLMSKIDKQLASTQGKLASKMWNPGTEEYKQMTKDVEILLGLKKQLLASDAEEAQRIKVKDEETKKFNASINETNENNKASVKIIGDLQDKYNKLTMSQDAYIKKQLEDSGLKGKELTDAIALSNSIDRIVESKKLMASQNDLLIKSAQQESQINANSSATKNAAIDAEIASVKRITEIKLMAYDQEKQANETAYNQHKISLDEKYNREIEIIKNIESANIESINRQSALQKKKLNEQITDFDKAYEA
ncbi:MAG: tape measure protein, partial [Methylococcaceae bacterium]|nr:tape measure protein [Methylococcaceae bacterium]